MLNIPFIDVAKELELDQKIMVSNELVCFVPRYQWMYDITADMKNDNNNHLLNL